MIQPMLLYVDRGQDPCLTNPDPPPAKKKKTKENVGLILFSLCDLVGCFKMVLFGRNCTIVA